MPVSIGITLGDPAGIGPEIVAKALTRTDLNGVEATLIGSRENFEHVAQEVSLPGEIMDRIGFRDIPGGGFSMGRISREAGSIALRSIEAAAGMAMDGKLDGICTAPINKEAILMAGSRYKDHTDMLGALTGSDDVSTVFETRGLRIIFLSKHVSMRDAIGLITRESVYRYIMLADQALRSLGIEGGRIAVAALNPHAGENGLFGREEIEILRPAIEDASSSTRVEGPFPADSVFFRASQGEFDMVLSLFHDQGHIAAKMYDFHRTVSMNIGLPFLRTSVDHGTAMDIAGMWKADETSMAEALRKSIEYSGNYRKYYNTEGGRATK